VLLMVGSSGVLYAVIVVAWAAYLVPMWLRRQDELVQHDPSVQFTATVPATSELSTPAQHSELADLVLETEQAGSPTELLIPATAAQPAPPTQSSVSPVRPQIQRAAVFARRRRVISMLFLICALGSVLAAYLDARWGWLTAGNGGLLVSYIGYLRIQEKRRHTTQQRQQRYRHETGLREQRAESDSIHIQKPAPVPLALYVNPAPETSAPTAEKPVHDENTDSPFIHRTA